MLILALAPVLSAQMEITSVKNNKTTPVATIDGAVFTTPPETVVSDRNGIHVIAMSENVTTIEEKSLAFDATLTAPRDPSGDTSNGVRFYSFTLKPKEKISLQLKAESANHVGMDFLKPSKADRMIGEFKRLEYMPKTLKSSRQEIKNVTDEPYQVVLMVYGRMQHWFKLSVSRSI